MAISRSNRPGRLQHVGQVGGCNHDQMLPFGQPVHQRQQLRHHPLFHFADHVLAAWRDGVDLIQKDDAGAFARGLLEDLAQMGLALAIELVDDLRAAHREEIGLSLMRNGARDQGLSASRRTMQQHALGGVDPQLLEDLRIAQWQLDHLADALQLRLQPSDVLVRGGARGHFLGLLRVANHQYRGGIDQHRSLGRGAAYAEVRPAAAKQRGTDAGAFAYRQAIQQAADIVHVAVRGPDVGRGQHNAFGGPANNLVHRHELIQPRPGVLAHQSVDLDARLPAQFLVRGHGLANGRALAGDLHRVANRDPQFLQVFRAHAGNPAADIPAQRLSDLEL